MTRTTPILIALMLCPVFVVGNATAADDKLDLKLRFTEGQELTLTTAVEQTTTSTWNDQERESKETTAMTMGLKVRGVDEDGTATIEVTIKAVALKRDMGRWAYEYDSENPPDEVPRSAAPFAAVVGKTFTMKLTPGGDVAGFEGVDALVKAAQEALPESSRWPSWGRDVIARNFSEDAFKRTMEGAFGFLPNEPVAVGDSWTRTINMDRPTPVVAEETYTLAERKDGIATIKLEAKLSPQKKEEAEGEAEEGPRVTHDVTGTQEGTLTVDEATGCLFKTAITQDLKGNVVMSGIRDGETERSMPITSKATITIETKAPQPEEEAGKTEEAPETD